MVRGLRGLLWLNANCWLFAFAFFVMVRFQQGRQRCHGAAVELPPWQLAAPCWKSAVQCDNAGFPKLSLSTSPVPFCSFLGGCRGRKGAASSSRGCLTAWHLGSVRMVSSNLVTDETGTCQTFTSWTWGLEKLTRLIWMLLWNGHCNSRTTILSEKC